MRGIGAGLVVLVVLLMTSCGSIPSGPKPSPDGPAEPLAFHQVTEIRPTPCPSGPDLTYVDPNEQQSCLVLGPSRLTITRLERVDVEQDQSVSGSFSSPCRPTRPTTWPHSRPSWPRRKPRRTGWP